ncbi:hypothetical protein [Pseudomonas donghuensis]|uniref:hypothetical protein n=1 Tax=Pseudomonas donghuensis TaxID=1163398 RepID=UPI000474F1D6|nr:hypothetical protein [Pseudomonas donghuensis]UVL31345.1 hypothetical protein LOY32_09710 [Pseudomonas donghuensis]
MARTHVQFIEEGDRKAEISRRGGAETPYRVKSLGQSLACPDAREILSRYLAPTKRIDCSPSFSSNKAEQPKLQDSLDVKQTF